MPQGKSVEETLAKIRKDSSVLYAEPDYIIQIDDAPNDFFYDRLWGLEKINVEPAWELTEGDDSVIVAVIDTGVDYSHKDLRDNMYVNQGEIPDNGIDDDGNGYIDDIYGYDFVRNDPDPMDESGHGTHCAGTIGAVGHNALGVIGVSPKVKIMALRFLNRRGIGYNSDAIRCIEYAVDNGAHVLSNSWGGSSYSSALKEAIKYAESKGIVFVAAAGNSNLNTDRYPHYPSCYDGDNVISIGASDSSDAKASFSNYGKRTVDVFAPGVGIISTFPGNQFKSYSGTSMATPHVAGAIALFKSFNKEDSPSILKQRIMDSSDILSGMENFCVSSGRLNVGNMIVNSNPPIHFDISSVIIEGGDGDGFAESGEVLDVFIEIKNKSGVMRDLSADLISTNGKVTVLSSHAEYPDMLPGDRTHGKEAFRIRVEDQDDLFVPSELLLKVKSEFIDTTDGLKVPMHLGNQCNLLLVDDDGGSVTERYIAESLDELGVSYFIWDVEEKGVPSLAEINPVWVIWNTGNMKGQVLSPDEINSMKNYLISGGALSIVGDEWADELQSDDITNDYFKVSVNSLNCTPAFQKGVSEFQEFDFILPHVAVQRDKLLPLSGASLLCRDLSDSSVGSVSLAHTSEYSGPVLAVAFDISLLDDILRKKFLGRMVELLQRPELVSLSPGSSSVKFSWKSLEAGQSVEARIVNSFGVSRFLTASGINSEFASLQPGSQYELSLRSVYADGRKSEWNRRTEFQAGDGNSVPLPAVSGVVIEEREAGLYVSWNKLSDVRVKSYNVEVYNTSGRIVFVNTEDHGMLIEQKYLKNNYSGKIYIYAQAVDSQGPVSVSNWTYRDVYPPIDVKQVQVVQLSGNKIRVTWGSSLSSDLKKYEIKFSPVGKRSGTWTDCGKSNSVVLKNVSEGKVLSIIIRTEDNSGNVSKGTSVLWGEDGRGDGNDTFLGCSGRGSNKSKHFEDNYKEAGLISSFFAFIVNFALIFAGAIWAGVRRIINNKRGQ